MLSTIDTHNKTKSTNNETKTTTYSIKELAGKKYSWMDAIKIQYYIGWLMASFETTFSFCFLCYKIWADICDYIDYIDHHHVHNGHTTNKSNPLTSNLTYENNLILMANICFSRRNNLYI